MRKVYTLLLIIVLSVPAFAIDKNMYNSGNIQPASPEFIKSLKAVSANDLGIFNPQTKQSETMVVEDSDTLTKYLDRMTTGRIFGIELDGRTYPLVGTNTFLYFVGQKFDLTQEQIGNYKLDGILIPYAINFTAGTHKDSSLIWVFQIDINGEPTGGSLLAYGSVYHGDADSSSSEMIFTYAPMDSNGVLTTNFLVFLQTRNFDAQETDFVAIWANDQGDGKGEKRSAILAWDQNSNRWVYSPYGDLQIEMADHNPPDFDVLLLPVLVPNVPDDVSGQITINGLTFEGLFPNPVETNARLDFSLNDNTPLTIDLLDAKGAFVKNITNNTFGAGEHSIDFSADDLASGVYMIVFRSAASSFAVKMMIAK